MSPQDSPTDHNYEDRCPIGFDGDDPAWAIAATQPRPHREVQDEVVTKKTEQTKRDFTSDRFLPVAPESLQQSGLSTAQLEALIAKFLLNTGTAIGRKIARQMCLPFGLIERVLHTMRLDQLVAIKSEGALGDYLFELTSSGIERARRYSEQTSYFGAAPVPLARYIEGAEKQSVRHETVDMERVRHAFSHLVVGQKLLRQMGEAMNMGCSLFIYGEPGNGKTTLSESINRAYSKTIWIPRAIYVGGEIVRLFDPIHHEECPLPEGHPDRERVDNRWVRIKRPTITVGGELELSDLDVATNPVTHINEASLQLKANCGTLVFDDFGRNRFRPAELLNRLIYPLENRVDALHASSGRTFRVPFDCLVVFATNLDPMALVDEAFLRRVPFSIHIEDPSEDEFRQVFHAVARELDVQFQPDQLEYLIHNHYRQANRSMRFCHPRDIIANIKNACEFRGDEPRVTNETIDSAIASMLSLRAS
ncbi:MAG: AAA family ATPase [Planctomycetales bacterium]|nr:AAA family ATPase [Planctomycetales bacterium]